jgi:hypothetical protein
MIINHYMRLDSPTLIRHTNIDEIKLNQQTENKSEYVLHKRHHSLSSNSRSDADFQITF